MQSNLAFFDKEGNYLNLRYNDNTERYEGDLIFHENSSDTFKTIGLYTFERVSSFEFESPGDLALSKFQLFNEYGFDFTANSYKIQKIDKIEAVNSKQDFFSKWIYGVDFESKFPLGTEVLFDLPILEFTNLNQSFTVVATKKNAIMILSSLDNRSFNNTYGSILGLTATYQDRTLSGLNAIGVYNYISGNNSLIENISSWSEPDFYTRYFNGRKLTVVNTDSNDGVYTVNNTSLLDKIYYRYNLNKIDLPSNSKFITEIILNTDLPIVYNGSIGLNGNVVTFGSNVPYVLKPGIQFFIQSSTLNTNYLTISDIQNFEGNNKLKFYDINDQVLFNNIIYQCIQSYTQSATYSITPDNTLYWSGNINYLNVDESLVTENILNTNIYLVTNVFYYEYDGTQSSEVTLSSFSQKYKEDLHTFNIEMYYEDNILNLDLIYASRYCNINFYKDSVSPTNSIGTSKKIYENMIGVKENLTTEFNTNYSKNLQYNVVFTDIDEYGIVIKVNGDVYQQEIDWIFNGTSPSMDRTIDKTLRNWLSYNYTRLYKLGVIASLSYLGNGSSVYYNAIILQTYYPNVPLNIDVQVGTTADFYIEHSNVIFYDLGNLLSININGKSYEESTVFLSANMPDIKQTLLNWFNNYGNILDNFGIYIAVSNNLMYFRVKNQIQRLEYEIKIGKSYLPGTNPFIVIDKMLGNNGSLIASNGAILGDDSTKSFIDSGFSTGMISSVNNTTYIYDNQEYNMLFVNEKQLIFSYQGPFWGTTSSACESSPFVIVAFNIGFGATACSASGGTSSMITLGGDFNKESYNSSFNLSYGSTNSYVLNKYDIGVFEGANNMVDILYLQLTQNLYILGDAMLIIDGVISQPITSIVLPGITQSISLNFNYVNSYLYALSKSNLYVVDPVINNLVQTINLTSDANSCVINSNNGDIYISHDTSNYVSIYNYSNVLVATVSTSDYNLGMVYNSVENDIYLISNGLINRIDGQSRTLVSTYSISGLTNSIFYEPVNSSVYVVGDYLYKIEGSNISQVSYILGQAFNQFIFNNLSGDIVLSQSDSLGGSYKKVAIDDTVLYDSTIFSHGYLALNQHDGNVYLSSQVFDRILILDSNTGELRHQEPTGGRVTKMVYDPARRSIFGLQPSLKSIIELDVELGSSINTNSVKFSNIYDSQYGTLSPNYIDRDDLWLKSRDYIRKPRYNYEGDIQTQFVWKWMTDDIPQMFIYDYSGSQLGATGPYAYIGSKPLSIATLNRYPNKDITKISFPEYQQTIFSQTIETLDYINSSSDVSFTPEPIETFLGFNSQDEGVTKSTLQLYKRENISFSIITDSTNINIIEFKLVSGLTYSYGIIEFDVNSTSNFLYDDQGNKRGLSVGQNIKLFVKDNTNVNNKYISFNNSKVFKIIELYNRSIIIDFIDDSISNEKTLIIDYPKFGEITYLTTTFKVVDKELARFNVYGQTEIEDVRYDVELSNIGKNITSDDTYIFKSYDINEQGVDWIFLNNKRKEMLLTKSEIYPYIGSYKSIINAINYFGYNDLELYEYYRNINIDSVDFNKLFKVEIPDIFDNTISGWEEKDFIKNLQPYTDYEVTNLFNLTYKITDKEGNNLLSYSLGEVLIKLQGLKNWLKNNIIPITHKILDITGRADFVNENSITHKSYDVKILNVYQSLTPVNFKINEAYLMPINSGSSVYNVVVDFYLEDNNMPDYFDVKIRTYKTEKEWLPFNVYQNDDMVYYYGKIWKSVVNSNKAENPRKYDNISEWNIESFYITGQIVKFQGYVYDYIGATQSGNLIPTMDSNWKDITKWIEMSYVPVQTINEFRTGTHSMNFTIDSNIDPLVSIEVNSDNGYGQTYTTKRNYEVIGVSTTVVDIKNLDPIGPFIPIINIA